MISALRQFDSVTAAGILARAALALDDNPAGIYRLPNEESLREAVIAEARRAHGINAQDVSQQTLERIGEILDIERENLIAPIDPKPALERLSTRGELPSDLFKIEIIRPIADFHGRKFATEKKLIEETVRTPNREQHYGPPTRPDQPFLISLFAREYRNKYPLRTFTMLVAGQRQRNSLKLDIHQAWRVYPSEVDLANTTSLVDVLHRFSDKFGAEMTLGDQRGHFILAAALPKGKPLSASWALLEGEPKRIGRRENRQITVTCFIQPDPRGETIQAALAVAIDLNRYRRVLESKGY
jgi:hypothetical protein